MPLDRPSNKDLPLSVGLLRTMPLQFPTHGGVFHCTQSSVVKFAVWYRTSSVVDSFKRRTSTGRIPAPTIASDMSNCFTISSKAPNACIGTHVCTTNEMLTFGFHTGRCFLNVCPPLSVNLRINHLKESCRLTDRWGRVQSVFNVLLLTFGLKLEYLLLISYLSLSTTYLSLIT